MTAGLLGAQRPRLSSVPRPGHGDWGKRAVDLAGSTGLHLDDWQQYVLEVALTEQAPGKWAALEVGVVVSRQNGKGALLEARELAALFLLEERMTIHSAHQFDTSLEAFRRLLDLIEDTPKLKSKVKRVSRSHGEEGIELKSGPRIRFRTRTKGGGRGFSCDCLILDEAMVLSLLAHGALFPTLSARPNPQVWYTGSAVDQEVHEHGLVLARVRERGIRGERGLAYFEWSAPGEIQDADEIAEDRDAWVAANPGLGIRIDADHVALEQSSMDPRTFAVERLGVGDWPDLTLADKGGITPRAWSELRDKRSKVEDPVCFSVDVRPDRSVSSIGVAGKRADGLWHVEVVERRPGTGWVADRVVGLVAAHDSVGVVCDGAGPAASLINEMQQAGVEVTVLNAKEHAQACGMLFDAVEQKTARHIDQPELLSAVKGAARRQLGDAWAWSRKNSTVDISPLVAVTLALFGSETLGVAVDPAQNIW